MSKKVTFNKPNREKVAEEWIKNRTIDAPVKDNSSSNNVIKEEAKEISVNNQDVINQKSTIEIKRITLDIPKNWHTRIKVICAEKGLKMNEEILPLLKKHFLLDD